SCKLQISGFLHLLPLSISNHLQTFKSLAEPSSPSASLNLISCNYIYLAFFTFCLSQFQISCKRANLWLSPLHLPPLSISNQLQTFKSLAEPSSLSAS